MSDGPWLVVGLGNPGAAVRGQPAQRRPDGAGRAGAPHGRRRSAPGRRGCSRAGRRRRSPRRASGVLPGGAPGPRVVLAKPTTYMNVSGGPVAALAKYYDVPPERTVLVHDELDIPFADVRLKRGGGEGGHNGLRDTTKALGTKDYVRVRVGRRSPARSDGPGRLRAARLRQGRAQGPAVAAGPRPRTRSRLVVTRGPRGGAAEVPHQGLTYQAGHDDAGRTCSPRVVGTVLSPSGPRRRCRP